MSINKSYNISKCSHSNKFIPNSNSKWALTQIHKYFNRALNHMDNHHKLIINQWTFKRSLVKVQMMLTNLLTLYSLKWIHLADHRCLQVHPINKCRIYKNQYWLDNHFNLERDLKEIFTLKKLPITFKLPIMEIIR